MMTSSDDGHFGGRLVFSEIWSFRVGEIDLGFGNGQSGVVLFDA
jgi:hypothetical protein